MDEKEKYEALMRQADFNINQFNKRRDHSWKVTLVFWAALIGSTGILETGKSFDISWRGILGGGVVLFVLYAFFMISVFKADKKDKALAFKARDLAIDLIGVEELINIRPEFDIDERKILKDWSALFQLITTGALIFLAGYIPATLNTG